MSSIGPGSQPMDEDLVLTKFATTRLAHDEAEFSVARASDPLATLDSTDVEQCREALELALKISDDLANLNPGDDQPVYDLTHLDETNTKVFNEIMGEGEVSMLLHAPVQAQITEGVLAGVWRVREMDQNGELTRDYVEIGDVPARVRHAIEVATVDRFQPGTPPEGAMNVMPVLAEISARSARYKPGHRNHVISFSLLPMSEPDQMHLQATLGRGPVHINSRGYGRCRVLSTGIRNVWAVQFYSASDEVVLDTIEIGDVPEAARAAKEDFEDSSIRMREIAEAYL